MIPSAWQSNLRRTCPFFRCAQVLFLKDSFENLGRKNHNHWSQLADCDSKPGRNTSNTSHQMKKKTRAGVCKTLCPQHLLAFKYGQIARAVIPQFFWTLLKRLTCNLFIISYQLTKFQTPSSNLADKVEMPFGKGYNSRKQLTEFVQKLIK